MAFFEKVNDFAKSTADKANDSIEISKLNSKIANEQSQMRDFARELGEVYWQLISAKTVAPAPEAEEICKKLELAAANIAGFEAEIAAIHEAAEKRKAELEAKEKEAEQTREEEKKVITEYASKQDKVKQLVDIALLGNGMLKGEALSNFLQRSISLL